jgi:hypothetical protein
VGKAVYTHHWRTSSTALGCSLAITAFDGGVQHQTQSYCVAEYSYEAGFLGRDSTFVTVRKRWGIFPDVVYQYAGPSDWTDTDVRWLNNEQLLVRYRPDGEGRFQQCQTGAAGIVVQCVATT